MKVKLVNVFQASGLSRKDGRPFSMSRATILGEFDTVSTEKYQREGAGLGVVEVAVSDACYAQLEKHVSDRFKGEVLELDVRTSVGRRGDLTIVGVEGVGAVPLGLGSRSAA